MLGKLALATAATMALGAGTSVATPPVQAPAPTQGDLPSALTYLEAYVRHQQRAITLADTATDQWWGTARRAAERRAIRRHRAARNTYQRGVIALRADTAGFGACRADLLRLAGWTKSDLITRERGLRRSNPRLIARAEREVGWDKGIHGLFALSTVACLSENGWTGPPPA